MYLRIMDVLPWAIRSTKLEKEHKRLQESLTSIGNGYMGMRGNFEETYSADSHLGTYIAGVWFPDKTRVGWWKNGYPKYFGKTINALNFSKVAISVDNQEIDLAKNEVADFAIELDMKTGVFRRQFTVFGVKFAITKFLSVAQKELAAIRWEMVAVDGKTHEVRINSMIDADVKNEDSNYEEKFWQVLAREVNAETSAIATQTVANPFGVEQFIVNAEQHFAGDFNVSSSQEQDWQVSNEFSGSVGSETQVFEKRVIITTSRDYADLEAVQKAGRELSEKVAKQSFADLLAAHKAGWLKRWESADMVISGNNEAQQGIRFNLFQLFATYYGEDARLNIGPKGFTGEKYGGATYWDTEAYAVPLYLALAEPQVTRNLLKYRHNQLPQAKHNAGQQGLAGALYPMVTFTGVECHNEWEITFEEIHRNGAIAYAIYNYTNYTGDESYLAKEGLEVLVEISRFWADRVHFSNRHGKYMMHGVTGPNEYENNINNNWYTNNLAAWVLEYTSAALAKYPRPDLNVSAEELAKWADIIANMYRPFDAELNVFVQHDGFLDKDLRPVSALSKDDLPLNQKWSWDKILRSPFIKQADVLQGIYFFGDRFTLDEKRRNFDFYEPMTVHESSLSPSIHAILAAELGKEEKAVEMYQRTARLDLDNYNNDTEDGLHITSMTGSWLGIVQGFAQMKTWGGKLSFAPFLPSVWTGYAFHINYRGRLIKVTVDSANVKLNLLKGDALKLSVYGQEVELKSEFVTALQRGE
ncbi:glycoside hydrolase family 65 protein [Kingella kingae]|uniref:glycoside hydrolase family 65 protein n=1 Tax=Kingella kingae TaxID=504 RepID=UPI00057198C5|nr:glycoside hydrolase family 65 protein [Kingella kingae]MDK4575904.1 glycoside hydrolase family 65 protein [Kingella kingae]MDK4581892.1 glycoside hydrolase family 65 protein [Kingella kingae]MDK4592162.1 glycoside hydrolase family 65 protein [Kingella kingae]MDK4594130.1 glycoside hydrolase family 65 protein [Kingella kingae]MDK4643731.1 glycoside hydrolase family 65 protein [Kingella kingae]